MSRVAPPRGERAPPEGSPLPAPSGPPPSPPPAGGGWATAVWEAGACSSPSPDPSALLYVESCFLFSVRETSDIFKNNLTQREQQKFCTKI